MHLLPADRIDRRLRDGLHARKRHAFLRCPSRVFSGSGSHQVQDIIENSRLYFSTPDQFNDPLDCSPIFKLAGDLDDTAFLEELKKHGAPSPFDSHFKPITPPSPKQPPMPTTKQIQYQLEEMEPGMNEKDLEVEQEENEEPDIVEIEDKELAPTPSLAHHLFVLGTLVYSWRIPSCLQR